MSLHSINPTAPTPKPRMTFWQIWNMCFGFLGIQFGFALQNSNVSRIFETLGAKTEDIPALWMAAPLTGLLVQPIIGYMSDRTWNRFGRRRPYFAVGAVLASVALLFFPHVPLLWIAAGMLWVLDASINIAMEPFRAFVGDQLPTEQRSTGFAMQSFFIGAGSVIASALPYIFEKFGVANTAAAGVIPDTVKYSFYCGGVVLFGAVMWTVLRSKEYPPEVLASHDTAPAVEHSVLNVGKARKYGIVALIIGLLAMQFVAMRGLEKELLILGGGVAAYGLLSILATYMRGTGMLNTIVADIQAMPTVMRRLAVVQFFSWFALFSMWIYTTQTVTSIHFGSSDPTSAAYNEGANWVGILFAAYNLFAALWAIFIPKLVTLIGVRKAHLINLILGGLGLLSIPYIKDPQLLLLSMVGIGIAWASIVSLPYTLLSDSVPASKMGTYMGIFNFFIVIPQLVAASILGFVLKNYLGNLPANALIIGGVCMMISGLLTLRVQEAGVHGHA